MQVREEQFHVLLEDALAEWPRELAFPVRSFGRSGYKVEGLTDLEDEIARRWAGRDEEALMRAMHRSIAICVHQAFAWSRIVRLRQLRSQPIREKFSAEVWRIKRGATPRFQSQVAAGA